VDEVLVVRGREIEPAVRILELGEHHFEQLHRKIQVLGAPSALHQSSNASARKA